MEPRYPRYVRVYRSLRERILSSELKPGEQLPRQHDLAALYGVAFATMQRALERLETDGFIIRKHGLGTFVADPKEGFARVLIVDSDAPLRDTLAAMILESGFVVDQAGSIESAVALLPSRRFTHVFCNLRLPDGLGIDMAARVAAHSPETAIVIMVSDPQELPSLAERDVWPVIILPKPFRDSQIQKALSMAMVGREPSEPAQFPMRGQLKA